LEPARSQHDLPTARVIAQQYSSTAFFSPSFYSRLEKLRALFKNAVDPILYISPSVKSETA
jgi:hypothetical protein